MVEREFKWHAIQKTPEATSIMVDFQALPQMDKTAYRLMKAALEMRFAMGWSCFCFLSKGHKVSLSEFGENFLCWNLYLLCHYRLASAFGSSYERVLKP